MHEFVLSGAPAKRELGVRTLDIAKRLLDFGFHPPTIYFPLLVDEALMIEPTETETRESLDRLAEAIDEILAEAEEDPEILRAGARTPRRSAASTRPPRQPQADSSASRSAERPAVSRRRPGTISERASALELIVPPRTRSARPVRSASVPI